jgi:hypothetical protein
MDKKDKKKGAPKGNKNAAGFGRPKGSKSTFSGSARTALIEFHNNNIDLFLEKLDLSKETGYELKDKIEMIFKLFKYTIPPAKDIEDREEEQKLKDMLFKRFFFNFDKESADTE